MRKVNLFSLLLMLSILFVGCDTEDEEPDSNGNGNGNGNGGDCAAEYIEEPVSGAIFDTDFSEPKGIVEEYALGDDEYIFRFYIESEGEECEITNEGEGYMINFVLPMEDLEGEYNLGVGEGDYAVTFTQEGEMSATAVTCGGIEITSVTDTHISGRIDAHYDSENTMNGEFTLPICD